MVVGGQVWAVLGATLGPHRVSFQWAVRSFRSEYEAAIFADACVDDMVRRCRLLVSSGRQFTSREFFYISESVIDPIRKNYYKFHRFSRAEDVTYEVRKISAEDAVNFGVLSLN